MPGKCASPRGSAQETTMSLQWIAEHLAIGSWTHVSNLFGTLRKRKSLKSEVTCMLPTSR